MAVLFALQHKYKGISKAFADFIAKEPIPTRVLGKTGIKVTSFGLGGEGVLRTYGRMKEAVHDRTKGGSLCLLEDSLKRLKTDHLDLWQLHDLRTKDDLDRIFSGCKLF